MICNILMKQKTKRFVKLESIKMQYGLEIYFHTIRTASVGFFCLARSIAYRLFCLQCGCSCCHWQSWWFYEME